LDVPDDIVQECAQLTKANSIEGCKLSHVPIVYTPWSNLRKAEGMADGQVGFHNEQESRITVVEHRINVVVNRLNKTKVEENVTPQVLRERRRERDDAETAAEKAERQAVRKKAAVGREEERQRHEEYVREKHAREVAEQESIVAGVALRAEAERKVAAALKEAEQADRRRAAEKSLSDIVEDTFTVKLVDKDEFKIGKKGKFKAPAAKQIVADKSAERGTLKADGNRSAELNAADEDADDNLWGADEDDDFWRMALCGVAAPPTVSHSGAGYPSSGGPSARYTSGGNMNARLGVLGEEVAAVASNARSATDMEKLAAKAHKQREEAAQKQAAARKAKEAKAEAKALALEQRRDGLQARRDEAATKVEQGVLAAQEELERALTNGTSEAMLTANRACQEDELVALEAIFADDFTRDVETQDAFRLSVEGENAKREPVRIALRVQFVPEYPSHLPPILSVVDGAVGGEEAALVIESLQAVFFERRGAASDDFEGIMHVWVDWIKDEWLATR
jgi:hypothetical protein